MSGSTPWRRKEHGIDRWSSVMFGKMCEVVMHKGNAFGHTIDTSIVPEKKRLQKPSRNAFDCIVQLGRGFNKFPAAGSPPMIILIFMIMRIFMITACYKAYVLLTQWSSAFHPQYNYQKDTRILIQYIHIKNLKMEKVCCKLVTSNLVVKKIAEMTLDCTQLLEKPLRLR